MTTEVLRRSSRSRRVVPALVAAALLALGGPAFAEDVFIEIDAKPIPPPAPARALAPAPPTVAAAQANGVSIAPVSDTTGMFAVPGDRELLESALRSAITEQPGARYRVVPLQPALAPCDRQCAVSAARTAGVRFLVASEIRLFVGAYVVTVEIVDPSTGAAIRTLQTDAVPETSALLAAVKAAARDVAAALTVLVGAAAPASAPAPTPTVLPQQQAVAAGQPWGGGAWGGNGAFAGGAPDPAAADRFRHKRNVGITLFVIGNLVSIPGGVFIGMWSAGADEGFLAAGIPLAVVGEALFGSGLGVWIANQVRLNRAKAGVRVGRALRLEGLGPIVAARDGRATGLTASFSF